MRLIELIDGKIDSDVLISKELLDKSLTMDFDKDLIYSITNI
jgi:hypothetical protein